MQRDVEEALAGGTWIFLGSLTLSLSGFVFWLLAAKLYSVEDLGIATSIVSAAMIASTFFSSGLNIATIREASLYGYRGTCVAIVLALILGSVAAALAYVLAQPLGYSSLSFAAPLFSFFSVLNTAVSFSLIGMKKFRSYFYVIAVSSVVKLGLLVALALLGIGVQAILISFLCFPTVSTLIGISIALGTRISMCREIALNEVKELSALSLSNYPYVFTTRFITVLGVYIFALVMGKPISTGALYVALMIVLALSGIPTSFLSASLAISIGRKENPFEETARLSIAMASAVAITISFVAGRVLEMLNPKLVEASQTLRMLILSIPSIALLTSAITKLNKLGKKRAIAFIGLTRLCILVALLIVLLKSMGIEGVAFAYLVATMIPVALAFRYLDLEKSLMLTYAISSLSLLASLLLTENLVYAIASPLVLLLVLHVTRATTVREVASILRIALREIAPFAR